MGRQRKRTGRRSKKASVSASYQEAPVKQVLQRQPLEDIAAELSKEQADSLCLELSDALKQIYGEFVNDLRSRKKKRLDSDNPHEQVQEYKLVVQSNYRKQYAAKVSNLVSAGYGEDAFEYLRENIIEFVKALKDQVVEVPDPALRIKVLEDAYHTLGNASEEVGKIVKVLFLYEREVNCENLNKFHFYEHVVKVVKQSLEEVSDTITDSTMSIENDLDLDQLGTEPQLNFSALQENKVWELQMISDSDDDEGGSGQSELSRMSIDELIVYIEDNPAPRNTKKKRSKGDSTRSSSPKEVVGDSEFEALIAKLKSVKPAANKVKPNLKPEWLQNLRREFLHKGRN
mmetsp:Transcript_19775/g.36432  ORF Transcript_19775/g.36432 Transcript_19775/m.36432 type:complete len:344 (-) Transcript_19775:8391-9422(-)|eukprot:CAMPEP_0204918846 /NCGR_PEP_ID=MMETSP1397-20131031/16463_1 /ASSEMBLY_ACC=CAM_ASM_000891 /TAXON_ID=49980 /ORGANISM="Climacostomum Climacostomum virens, Strain Stock W-24" /LENGTH=343 /DNA_ID=CAMNT_0052092333 /DNA_START=1847 /DNA_END=2878 /DNA_ORIENTATION=-